MSAPTFFDGYLQWMAISSVIILAVGTLTHLLFRKSAVWRYQIWLCVLSMVMLLPAATWIFQQMNWQWAPKWELPRPSFTESFTPVTSPKTSSPSMDFGFKSNDASIRHIDSGTPNPLTSTTPQTNDHMPDSAAMKSWIHSGKSLLFWTWSAGLMFLIFRWAIGWRQLVHIIRHSEPIACHNTHDILRHTVHHLRLKRTPQLRLSNQITTPMVIGTWKPSILLPSANTREISNAALEQILIHECAHIQRRDHWVWLFQRIGRMICWINPFYHWMHAELNRAREELCDNHVLQHWTGLDYAQTLSEVSNAWKTSNLPISGLAIGYQKHPLLHRIESLLDPTADHRRKLKPISQATSAILFSGLMLSSVMVTAGLSQEKSDELLTTTADVNSHKPTLETTKLRPYPDSIKPHKYLMPEVDEGFEVEYYPWVEDSDYQRIPKSLLELYPVQQFTWSSSSSSRLRINGAYSRLLGMTHQQVTDLNQAIAQAIYDYDMLKANLMQFSYHSKEEKVIQGRTTIESVGFDWPPLTDDLINRFTEIRVNLENKVNSILDPAQAAYFWKSDESANFSMLSSMTDGALSMNSKENLRTENLVFVLERFKSGLIVSMKGGNIAKHSGPLHDGLDQYVPEAMKPILADWRLKIKASPPTEAMKWSVAKSISSENYPQPGDTDFAFWHPQTEYVDLPKSHIHKLGLHGLLSQEHISLFAISLLGLTKDEMDFSKQTFDHFKGRFEVLEKLHFRPIEPTSINDRTYTHYLDSFPAEAETLKLEWLSALVTKFGELRANQLDKMLRTHESRHFSMNVNRGMFRRGGPNRFEGFDRFSRNNWLNNGNKSWHIRYSGFPTLGEDGEFDVQWVDSDGSPGRTSGSSSKNYRGPFLHLMDQ